MVYIQYIDENDPQSYMSFRSNYILLNNNSANLSAIVNGKLIDGVDAMNKDYSTGASFSIETTTVTDIMVLNSNIVLSKVPSIVSSDDLQLSHSKYNKSLIDTDIRYISNSAAAVLFHTDNDNDILLRDLTHMPEPFKTEALIKLNKTGIKGKIRRDFIEE